MDTRGLWQAVLGELELTLSGAAFKTWFRNTAIISQQDGHVVVAVPNVITKDWLERKFNGDINRILERIHPGVESVEYRVTSDGKGATQSTAARDQLLAPAAPPSPAQAAVAPIISSSRPSMGANHTSKLNPKYTLDSFVVGPSNELAYAASQAVATYPGEKYNPFFMYGGVGLGKTHLMQAIGNEILRRDAGKRIRYVTSEEFTNEFTSTIRDKKTKNFTAT
jgi:chromosomal replication initiator protein